MSDYKREKVLRIPFEDLCLDIKESDDLSYDLWKKFGDIFYWCGSCEGKFELAPTTRMFIDFVLESEYGSDCGDWGKVRELYPQEIDKYKKVFQKICPTVDMSKVRLVEFCWYNGCEAPNYYDPMEDDFYREIPFVCSFNLD